MQKVSNKEFQGLNQYFQRVPIADKGSQLTSIDIIKNSEPDAFYFRKLEETNIKLNQAQIDAVRKTEGPLLIIAGAGTGKTTVLISRIGYMFSVKQIPADKILLVTFTKKAANEMKERIAQIPGITPRMNRELNTGTFHSVFLRILREQGDRRRVLSNEKFKQIVIKKILKEMKLHDDYQPETILSLISSWKNQMKRPSDIETKSTVDKELKEIYKRYERWKEENQYLDFDDFMIETYFLFKYEPEVLKQYQDKFSYILVDEFQDTSFIQYELMKMLAAPQNNFCVVGDDAQTIYGFRGAESSYILNFHKEFTGTERVVLDLNYRSNGHIVGLGNAIIKKNKMQIQKQLKTMKDLSTEPKFLRPINSTAEAETITRLIEEQVASGNKSYKDFAIIYRTYSASRSIFEELALRQIPFVTNGKEQLFYNNSFVKPVVDILRLTQDSNNEDAILSVAPMFYLRKDVVSKALERIQFDEMIMGKTYPNKLKKVIDMASKEIKSFQVKSLQEKLSWINKLSSYQPQRAIKMIREGNVFAYEKYLEMNERKSLTFHKEMVKEMLDELENSAQKHKTIDEYLTFIDQITVLHKEMEETRQNDHADVVRLMTIHQSKGLEFDTVFLISFIEEVLPHSAAFHADKQEDRIQIKQTGKNVVDEALEEERRLAYVAITRAKNELYISAPKIHHGEKVKVSRFLTETLIERS